MTLDRILPNIMITLLIPGDGQNHKFLTLIYFFCFQFSVNIWSPTSIAYVGNDRPEREDQRSLRVTGILSFKTYWWKKSKYNSKKIRQLQQDKTLEWLDSRHSGVNSPQKNYTVSRVLKLAHLPMCNTEAIVAWPWQMLTFWLCFLNQENIYGIVCRPWPHADPCKNTGWRLFGLRYSI